MKNYQKNAIFPSVLVSCMTNQLIHAEYDKTHYGIYRSLIWRCIWTFGSNGLQTKWLLVALAQTTSPLHAMFMHHIVAYDCVDCRHCSFSIGPAPESVPECLSMKQCLPCWSTRQANPPCSFRYNPTLSLLLSVIALGQQRFICYFVPR